MDINSRIVEIPLANSSNCTDLYEFLNARRNALCQEIESVLSSHSHIKISLCLLVTKCESLGTKLIETRNYLLIYRRQVLKSLDNACNALHKRFRYLSNSHLYEICNVKCIIYKLFNSPYGGMNPACGNFLPLKSKFSSCILSITLSKRLANECFVYAVAAALKKVPRTQRPFRPHHYRDIIKTFAPDSFCKSMPIHMFSKFESANKLNLNVFTIDCNKKQLVKLYLSGNSYYEQTVNLLLYNQHYFTIRNMVKLIKTIRTGLSVPATQYSKKLFTTHTLLTCNKCFQVFYTHKALKRHSLICLNDESRFKMPKNGSYIEFSKHRSMFIKPMIHFFDFECMIENYGVMSSENIFQEGRHVPIAVGILRVCADNDKFSKEIKTFHGENVISQFWDYLEKEQMEVETIIRQTNYPINFSNSQLEIFKKAIRCYCCNKLFSSSVKKVADHNHLIEKHNFRFALCDKCNLTYGANVDFNLTLLCHNLNYDIKFLLEKLDGKKKVEILAKNSQNFLSVRIGRFLFLDTMNFLNGSLAQNVETVKRDSIDHFIQTKKMCPDANKLNLLLKKQVYPYDYAKKIEDYSLPTLPPLEKFYNKLTEKNITKEDYEHAKKIYKLFNCKTFLDYTLIYLATDVYLLCDCFELFRKNTMINSGLDAAKFVTKHSLNFQEYLLYSREKISLLTDRTMLEFIQKGIRGGFSVINQKLCLANNEFCGQLYDSSKPKSYMLYLDANNLYSKALSYRLAFSGYEWLSQDEMEKIDFATLSPEDDIGYIVEVDLIYPEKIHDQTADFPFCLEKMIIKEEMLSSYSRDLKNKLGVRYSTCPKLVGTLYDKKKYIIHSRLLSFFLNNGMKLTKVHRALKFYQKEWLKGYMDKNTKMRQKSDSKIMRDFYKLKNNSIYGKLLQSDKGKIQVKIVSNTKDLDAQISRPNFKSYRKLNDNIILIILEQTGRLTRPLPAALCCLDFAKLVMYEFHKITRAYLKNSRILFSDTDSFLLYVETDNIYKDLLPIKQYLDTSNYHQNHELFSSSDRLVPGLFKDEFPIQNISHPEIPMIFIGLKPKMYMLYSNYDRYYVKSKGIGGNKTKAYKLQDFINAILHGTYKKERITSIRSRDAQIFTERSIKMTLNPFDDKRYFINAIFSIPYGYYHVPVTSIGE